jgi:hypothetical protein
MFRIISPTLWVALVAASLAVPTVMSPAVAAETMNFESATAMLAESCGKDIDDNCLGVSLDAPRLKECLSRNQDSVSPQCRTDYIKAFDAINKHIAARVAVGKACLREKQKLCADAQNKAGETMTCLLKAPTKSLGWGCNKALGDAGYR